SFNSFQHGWIERCGCVVVEVDAHESRPIVVGIPRSRDEEDALVCSFARTGQPDCRTQRRTTDERSARSGARRASPAAAVRNLSRRERKDKIKNLSEKFRQFLTDVEPIMNPTELDTFLVLETDPQREIYVTEFWRRRDTVNGTTNHSF